jgi:hypothetical protein
VFLFFFFLYVSKGSKEEQREKGRRERGGVMDGNN